MSARHERLTVALLTIFGLGSAGYFAFATAKIARQMPTPDYVTRFEERTSPLRDKLPEHGPVRFLERPGTAAAPGRPADYIHFLMLQYSLAPVVMVFDAPADTAIWWGGPEGVPPGPDVLKEWETRGSSDSGLVLFGKRTLSR